MNEPDDSRGVPTSEEIAAWLSQRLAAPLGITPGTIDRRQPFAGFGLGSLQAVDMAGGLERWLGRPLSPTLLYEYPTIDALSRHLAGEEGRTCGQPVDRATAGALHRSSRSPSSVLPAGFPEPTGRRSSRDLLSQGRDAVGSMPGDRRLDAMAAGWNDREAGTDILRGAFLPEIDRFDAAFFGISPREAAQMDPQQRLLLELAWHAFEDAGLPPSRVAGEAVGTFIGVSTNDYGRLMARAGTAGDGYALTGNAASIAANRIAYTFDLRGPSMAIDAACASSLLAIHQACRALRDGEATMVLAGGVNVILAPEVTAGFARAGLLAADGRCKAFDADADGFVRGEGAGLVLLKPLSRAMADRDPIHAVIRGSATNQDGRTNGLTAPGRLSQEAVLRAAVSEQPEFRRRGFFSVEAQGTGTRLFGRHDRDTYAASARVLGEERRPGEALTVGSVKTNIGHLEAAAGVASVIKAALILRHRSIPSQPPSPSTESGGSRSTRSAQPNRTGHLPETTEPIGHRREHLRVRWDQRPSGSRICPADDPDRR